jgi:predicted phage-related endonuclease
VIEERKIEFRDEWLSWRKPNLNASDIPALFGHHPYLTLAKLTAIKRGTENSQPESVMMRKGSALEPVAADQVAKLHPSWQITKCGSYFVDRDRRIGATPDFFVIDPERPGRGVLQTKVLSPATHRVWKLDDRPSYYALLQTQLEMVMTKADWGVIAALVVGDYVFECHLYPVERHQATEDRLLNGAAAFWAAFDAGEEPTIDYERDGELIALLYPTAHPGKVVDLTMDNRILKLLEDREEFQADRSKAEKKIKAAETEIKEKLGSAEVATVMGWRVSLKHEPRAAHFVKASNPRVLRVSRIEEKTA